MSDIEEFAFSAHAHAVLTYSRLSHLILAHRATDDLSLHITAGVIVPTWYDVVLSAATMLANDVRFREALPIGYATNSSCNDMIETKIKELSQAISENISLSSAVNRAADRFISTLPIMVDGLLPDMEAVRDLNEHMQVRKRDSVLYRFHADQNSTMLLFHGKRLDFPPFVASSLEYILNTQMFTPKMIPGCLDLKSKIVLVRRLINEGFLTLQANSIENHENRA